MRTVAIVDRFALARIGVERLLSSDPDVDVVASVEDNEALDLYERDIDVVILGLPFAEGWPTHLDGAPHARRRGAVLAICGRETAADPLLALLRHGVAGLVSRTTGPEEFRLAVDAVARGGRYVASDVMAMVESARPAEQIPERSAWRPSLAPRELETVGWLVNGLTHRQVAHRMGLTEATVNTYVKRLRAKLSVGNKAELTRKVIELGYLRSS
jgi:DNA-binding NarL/FixJ family response regulator